MTLSCDDAPCTSVVSHDKWCNEWGGECRPPSPKLSIGEVVMTVGFFGRRAKIAIGFVGGKQSTNNWIQKIGSNAINISEQTNR